MSDLLRFIVSVLICFAATHELVEKRWARGIYMTITFILFWAFVIVLLLEQG